MSLTTRLHAWLSSDALRRARESELRGDLEAACAAYGEAGQHGDVVRLTLVRAQGALEPQRRAQLLAQATALAPEGDPARLEAWRARAWFILDRVEAGGLDPAIRRRELLEAGAALRALGEGELAARALREAGDREGELAALEEAGAVVALEEAVERQARADASRARRTAAFVEARDLVAIGRRREANALLGAALAEGDAEELHALRQSIVVRRPPLPARVVVDGRALELVPGTSVVLGRSDGALVVPAPVVSRRHLAFDRREGGLPWLEDLGGKNGTTIGGARVSALAIDSELELLLGHALPMRVRPFERGGLLVELPGRACWLPLGPLELGGRRVEVEATPDGWLELRVPASEALFLGELRVDGALQLLVGDELFDQRDGRSLLRVAEPLPAERA